MRLSIIFSFVLLSWTQVYASPCLPGGDERSINAALAGPTARAVLCAGSIFLINNPIVLSAAGQELLTEGLPDDGTRAIIRVTGGGQATAIFSHQTNIAIRNIIVDGSRPRLGRIGDGGALIEVGGDVSGVIVEHVRAFDPRGWSVLHVFEGDRSCTGARIAGNEIGPSGTPDAWADGISFACRDGLVSHNIVTDASDGGIVVFGSPGSIIEDNLVRTRDNIMLGGINLVDYLPFDGDYSGTVVRHNEIVAEGGFIKVAIAIGPAAWGIGHGELNRGGTVAENVIRGDMIGFGIAVDGARDFTVMGNRVDGHQRASTGPRCDKNLAPPGEPFVRDVSTTGGRYQDQFVNGDVRYAICVEPVHP